MSGIALFKQDEGVWRVTKSQGMDANLEGEGRFSARRGEGEVVSYLTVTYIGEVTLSP